jgi:hypothetical protein
MLGVSCPAFVRPQIRPGPRDFLGPLPTRPLTTLFLIVKEQRPRMCGIKYRGAEGDRTPDLLVANQTLSQLSYSPGE